MRLIGYLESGGAVYAEGADIGFHNQYNEIWPYFACSYLGDGYVSSTGNVQTVAGQTNTPAAGMVFGYLYRQNPDNYLDEFGSSGASVVLRDQLGIGRTACYRASRYRTIVSSVIFGAMQGTQRVRLMAAYVRWLLTGTGVAEPERGYNPRFEDEARFCPRFAGPARAGSRLRATGPGDDMVKVYDPGGRLVNQAKARDLSLTDFSGRALSPGTYFVVAGPSVQTLSVVH